MGLVCPRHGHRGCSTRSLRGNVVKPCRECRHQISEQAFACPNCGAPFPARESWDGWGYEYKSNLAIAWAAPASHLVQVSAQSNTCRGSRHHRHWSVRVWRCLHCAVRHRCIQHCSVQHCRFCARSVRSGLFTRRTIWRVSDGGAWPACVQTVQAARWPVTLKSSGRPTSVFACCWTPLMSNIGRHDMQMRASVRRPEPTWSL